MARHPGQHQMYNTLRRKFFSTHMANDVYITVYRCSSSARNLNCYRYRLSLQLFPSPGSFDQVAMNILGSLSKTTSKNRHMVVITNSYSRLTCAIQSLETASTHIVNIFLNLWIILYGTPFYIQTDSGTYVVFRCFAVPCGLHGVKHLTTTAYRPRANGQAGQFNQMVETLF